MHAFPTSATRQRVFDGWSRLRAITDLLMPERVEYVDGSFVTDRLDPRDLDLVMVVESGRVDAADPRDQDAIERFFFSRDSHARIKEAYCVDIYVALVQSGVPQQQRDRARMKLLQTHWPSYSDPQKLIVPGVVKGYVEVAE